MAKFCTKCGKPLTEGEVARLNEEFIVEYTYNSNAIEGNTLSYAETYAIIFNDNTIPVTAKPRELYEAVNLKYAMNYLEWVQI